MHSNEDDSPLYLFIQLKPYPHTFGRKMHVVETSIHMSFLTAFGWLCFKRRWLGVSIIVSTTGNGIFWNQKCTACLRPMFKTILLNTSFIILFNLVFAQTVSISGQHSSSMGKNPQSLSTILQRPIFTCQQYKVLSQQDTQIFSTTDFLVNHPFYSLFYMKQHTVSDFRNSSKPKVGFGAFEIRYFARWKFRLHIFFTKSF